MNTSYQQFKSLHQSNDLFVLPNVWNPKSAILFQQKKFPAIGTSSAAVAAGLGYEDGEQMPFDEYLFIIKRILSSVEIPLTVDLEMGYGKTNGEIYEKIWTLIDLGVVGINLEDSMIKNGGRVLKDADEFAETVQYIKRQLAADNADLFINIRCDTYILSVANKKTETQKRLQRYSITGADGIFVPCITEPADIQEAISATKLPLNVMCMPGLPGFEVLNQLGVKRVSMGPFLFNNVYEQVVQRTQQILDKHSFSPLFS